MSELWRRWGPRRTVPLGESARREGARRSRPGSRWPKLTRVTRRPGWTRRSRRGQPAQERPSGLLSLESVGSRTLLALEVPGLVVVSLDAQAAAERREVDLERAAAAVDVGALKTVLRAAGALDRVELDHAVLRAGRLVEHDAQHLHNHDQIDAFKIYSSFLLY